MADDWPAESISPTKWSLAGSVTTPAHLLRTSNSLTVVRPFGTLTSQIRFAMSAKSILPVVEINTENGKVTLVNAKIVSIQPYIPPAKPESSMPPSGFVAGIYAENDNTTSVPKGRNRYEQEEIKFAFQQIEFSGSSGITGASDDWNVGSGGKKK